MNELQFKQQLGAFLVRRDQQLGVDSSYRIANLIIKDIEIVYVDFQLSKDFLGLFREIITNKQKTLRILIQESKLETDLAEKKIKLVEVTELYNEIKTLMEVFDGTDS